MSNDLVKRLRECSSDEAMWSRQAADRIEQLEAEVRELNMQVLASGSQAQEAYEAQLKAEAATAAAYEVAALAIMEKCHDDMDRKEEAVIVRALATPDQTAALERLIAETEARVWEKAAKIANDHTPEKHGGATLAAHVNGRNIEAAILDASKKGGV